ncbi:hypothetical protein CN918_32035 [Priestia megaterium]|nr:hypothetical protein CN918_32035 [Priestia megaterium]
MTSALFLCFPHVTTAKSETIPTKEQLFKQQMFIYETNRYIKRTDKQIKELNEEIPLLHDEIKEQKEEITDEMDEAKASLVQLYGGGQTQWIELYLNSHSIEDGMTVQHISAIYTEKQLQMLTDLNKVLEQLIKKERDLKRKKTALQENIKGLKKKKRELKEEEIYYKETLQLEKDVAAAKSEVKRLMKSWKEDGLPSFKQVFRILSDSINSLPSMVTKKNIHSKSLFKHEVVISDKELNAFLEKEDKLFRKVRFTFDNQKLTLKGTYNGLKFIAVGHYITGKSDEMKFSIDKLEFQGVRLPQVTIDEMEERYDLGFYPSEIVKGAKVTNVDVDDGKLRVEIKL